MEAGRGLGTRLFHRGYPAYFSHACGAGHETKVGGWSCSCCWDILAGLAGELNAEVSWGARNRGREESNLCGCTRISTKLETNHGVELHVGAEAVSWRTGCVCVCSGLPHTILDCTRVFSPRPGKGWVVRSYSMQVALYCRSYFTKKLLPKPCPSTVAYKRLTVKSPDKIDTDRQEWETNN